MTDFYNFIESELGNRPFKISIIRHPNPSNDQYQVEVSVGWASATKYYGEGKTINLAIIECLKEMKESGVGVDS